MAIIKNPLIIIQSGSSIDLTHTQELVNNLGLIVGPYPYSIDTDLEHCTLDNNATYVYDNQPFSTYIIPDVGYTESSVLIEMDGVDITSIAYDSDNSQINIPNVTGDISITVICA